MARWMPPPCARGGGEGPETDLPRCPKCGSGELFSIDVTRRSGGVKRATYCAGLYDRDRRRFVRRSCGYSDAGPSAPEAIAAGG